MPTGTNPHEAVVPDYLIVHFEATQLPLINTFIVTHEEVAECLTNIWRVQNQLNKQEWDRVLTKEAQAQQNTLEQQCLDAEDLWCTKQEEQENTKREEWKKNCFKFVPFPDTPIPSTTLVIPSPLTAHKLCKGKFCELYFFTNKSLAEVEALSHSINNEVLYRMRTASTLSFPQWRHGQKNSIINDEDLTWPKFDEAVHWMLKAIKENGWDDQCINTHLQFWMALSAHKWKNGADEISKKSLLIYQAHICHSWHDTLSSAKAFNLHHLNTDILSNIRSELVHKTAISQIAQMKMVCPLFTIRGSASSHLSFLSPPLCFPFTTYLTLQASHSSSIPSICPRFPLSLFSLHAQLLHLSHHPDPTLPWVHGLIPCLFSSVFMTPLSSSRQLPCLHDFYLVFMAFFQPSSQHFTSPSPPLSLTHAPFMPCDCMAAAAHC